MHERRAPAETAGGARVAWRRHVLSPVQFASGFGALVVACSPVGCGSRTGLSGAAFDLDAGAGVGVGDSVSPLDASPSPGALECTAPATLIYLISENAKLFSFDPSTLRFRSIGPIVCPWTQTCAGAIGQVDATPFSMAVDHTGIAYVVYCNGELFRVDTATAACSRTPFVPQQDGYTLTFGMGYSQNAAGTAETLYVASDSNDGGAPPALAAIDTGTFKLKVVNQFSPSINGAELTGTGAGGLFGFYSTAPGNDSAIVQIDKSTARVFGQSTIRGVPLGNAWAFAFWGGDFYTFTAEMTAPSTVHRFRPSDGSLTFVINAPEQIVGAGVSTCAPQR